MRKKIALDDAGKPLEEMSLKELEVEKDFHSSLISEYFTHPCKQKSSAEAAIKNIEELIKVRKLEKLIKGG